MPVKIRLQRKGRKQAPFYHIVIADARAPRDGRFIEKIGTYNPLTTPATIELNSEKAYQWLKNGAQPTDTVRSILRFKGVLFQKHLDRGVTKGAMTREEAADKLATWQSEKQGRVEARRDASTQQKLDFKTKVDGVKKVKAKPAPVVEEPAEEAIETAPAVEETAVAAAVESPVAERAAAPEEAAQPTEEAPALAEAAPVAEETAAPVVEGAVAEPEAAEAPVAPEAPVAQTEAPEAPVAQTEAPVEEPAMEATAATETEVTAATETDAPAETADSVAEAEVPAAGTDEETEKTKEA